MSRGLHTISTDCMLAHTFQSSIKMPKFMYILFILSVSFIPKSLLTREIRRRFTDRLRHIDWSYVVMYLTRKNKNRRTHRNNINFQNYLSYWNQQNHLYMSRKNKNRTHEYSIFRARCCAEIITKNANTPCFTLYSLPTWALAIKNIMRWLSSSQG